MHDVGFASGWDTALFMAPFVAMMAMSLFRVDERVTSPRRSGKTSRRFCHLDGQGKPIVFDPDGRLEAEAPTQGSNLEREGPRWWRKRSGRPASTL